MPKYNVLYMTWWNIVAKANIIQNLEKKNTKKISKYISGQFND